MLLARIPRLLGKVFRSFVWEIPTNERIVYLTFDDGPTPGVTEWVLNELDRYDAKATFFCLGKNVQAHPDIYSSITDRGHSVGNHSFSHVKGFRNSVQAYVDDVQKASAFIQSELYRPPYGRLRSKQRIRLQEDRYKIVMWTTLSIDYNSKLEGRQVISNVTDHVRPGSIIVFHDSLKAEKNVRLALPPVLEYLKGHSYKMNRIEPALLS